MSGCRRRIKPSVPRSDSPPHGLAPTPAPRRLPPPGHDLHAQRARLGLWDRRAQSAGLRSHAQRAGDDGPLAVHALGARASSVRPRRRSSTVSAFVACCPSLYVAEAAIFATLALLTSSPWLPLVLALAAADGILALVGRALTRAAVAATLKPDGQLDAGNTLLNVSFSLCFAIGPAIGGLVIAAWGVARGCGSALGSSPPCASRWPRAARCRPRTRMLGETWLARVRAGISHALGKRGGAPHLLRARHRTRVRRDDLADRGHLGQGGPRRRQQRVRHRPQRMGRRHAGERSGPRRAVARAPRRRRASRWPPGRWASATW